MITDFDNRCDHTGFLINYCENLAMPGLDERCHFLIMGLPLLVAEESRRVLFKRRQVGHGYFQDQRVERACNIGR